MYNKFMIALCNIACLNKNNYGRIIDRFHRNMDG